MRVTPDDVRRIAALAALAVDPEDTEEIATDLSAIVGLIRQIEAEVDEEVPAHQHGPASAPWREDQVTRSDLAQPPDTFAPEFQDGFIVAPRPPGVGSDS